MIENKRAGVELRLKRKPFSVTNREHT